MPDGDDWSVPEQNNLGEWYTWMASTKASLKMYTSCAGAASLKIRVLAPMAPDILQKLRLDVNGLNISVEASRQRKMVLSICGDNTGPGIAP